jgi:hypothetical protein
MLVSGTFPLIVSGFSPSQSAKNQNGCADQGFYCSSVVFRPAERKTTDKEEKYHAAAG